MLCVWGRSCRIRLFMAAALSAGSPSDLQMRCLGATLGKLPRDTASGAVWYKASHNNSAGGRILKRSLDFSIQYASFEKKNHLAATFGERFVSIFVFPSSLGLSLQAQSTLTGLEALEFGFLYYLCCHIRPLTAQLLMFPLVLHGNALLLKARINHL